MTAAREPISLVVSIMCVDDEPDRFCRRLGSMVSGGPMHLASVIATGTQIYPVRLDSWHGSATMLRCEFRMRKSGSRVGDADVSDLLDRISSLQVLDSHFVDGHGVSLGPASMIAAAS